MWPALKKHALKQYWAIPRYRYTAFLFISIGALLVQALSTLWYQHHHQQWQLQTANAYGNSLITLAADQSASSTASKDSISLQTIARNIAQQTAVDSIIIYDIENNIMAQVSKEPSDADNLYFTAPIVASDNLVGSITLAITPSQLSETIDYQPMLLLSILLLIILIISAYRVATNIKHEANSGSAKNGHDNTDKNTNNHPLVDPQAQTNQQDLSRIYLLLNINNAALLYKQLNGESRAQQLMILQQHIEQVSLLYKGKVVSVSGNSIVLEFSAKNSDAIYHALYSADLIIRLNQQHKKSILLLNGFIQQHASTLSTNGHTENSSLSETIDTQQKNNQAHQNTLFIDEALIEQHQLAQQIDIHESPKTESKIVKNFKESYKNLLDSQLQKLT